jgi:hypothetical protein
MPIHNQNHPFSFLEAVLHTPFGSPLVYIHDLVSCLLSVSFSNLWENRSKEEDASQSEGWDVGTHLQLSSQKADGVEADQKALPRFSQALVQCPTGEPCQRQGLLLGLL